MPYEVSLSVRALVEFLLRGGSIDNRFGGQERALEGARIHRRLQKAGGEGYQAEVLLSLDTPYHAFLFHVEGRADGVITAPDGGVTVDEIKTTAAPMELITPDFNRVHWAQAMCYAHFLCLRDALEAVTVQLTYFQVDTEEIRRFSHRFSAGELADFYTRLLGQYEKWAQRDKGWREVRGASIAATAFPFAAYRRGQREMAVAVYRTIQTKSRLFCQAPTGIGKTISALFPAVKAMGEGMGERIFYLTAKTVARAAAEDALAALRANGLRLKSVTLTAKDKICFLEERDCNPDACPYAKGYYDRANEALFDLLEREDHMTRETIEACARETCLCPFELSLDLTNWCDCVICDYNYLFDPVVSLKRFFSDAGGDYIFLIDEAHNLVDRARDMYSAQLKKSDVLALRRTVGKSGPLSRALGGVNTALLALRKSLGEENLSVREAMPDELAPPLARLTAACEEWLEEHREHPARAAVLDMYFAVRFYQRIAELYDEHYATVVHAQGKEVTVRLMCLDPSHLLDEAMDYGRAAILFSATLSPLSYFSAVLGGSEKAKTYALPSPFDPDRLRLLVADRISTKYRDRQRSLRPVAELIATLAGGRRGNYMAYFPSYQYMNDVLAVFQEQYPQFETITQSADMDEAARAAFLARFDRENRDTLIGFCVLGGIYAEGVDLKGDRLIGTAVVGVGLPQINVMQDILRDYYDRRNGRGFAFAYQYPGMNKVLQAAGRVIRGEADRGVVLLIDSRFGTPDYQALFPPHWAGWRGVRSPSDLARELASFW